MCPMALECGLKDSRCSTEWMDMRFKHISEFVSLVCMLL